MIIRDNYSQKLATLELLDTFLTSHLTFTLKEFQDLIGSFQKQFLYEDEVVEIDNVSMISESQASSMISDKTGNRTMIERASKKVVISSIKRLSIDERLKAKIVLEVEEAFEDFELRINKLDRALQGSTSNEEYLNKKLLEKIEELEGFMRLFAQKEAALRDSQKEAEVAKKELDQMSEKFKQIERKLKADREELLKEVREEHEKLLMVSQRSIAIEKKNIDLERMNRDMEELLNDKDTQLTISVTPSQEDTLAQGQLIEGLRKGFKLDLDAKERELNDLREKASGYSHEISGLKTKVSDLEEELLRKNSELNQFLINESELRKTRTLESFVPEPVIFSPPSEIQGSDSEPSIEENGPLNSSSPKKLKTVNPNEKNIPGKVNSSSQLSRTEGLVVASQPVTKKNPLLISNYHNGITFFNPSTKSPIDSKGISLEVGTMTVSETPPIVPERLEKRKIELDVINVSPQLDEGHSENLHSSPSNPIMDSPKSKPKVMRNLSDLPPYFQQRKESCLKDIQSTLQLKISSSSSLKKKREYSETDSVNLLSHMKSKKNDFESKPMTSEKELESAIGSTQISENLSTTLGLSNMIQPEQLNPFIKRKTLGSTLSFSSLLQNGKPKTLQNQSRAIEKANSYSLLSNKMQKTSSLGVISFPALIYRNVSNTTLIREHPGLDSSSIVDSTLFGRESTRQNIKLTDLPSLFFYRLEQPESLKEKNLTSITTNYHISQKATLRDRATLRESESFNLLDQPFSDLKAKKETEAKIRFVNQNDLQDVNILSQKKVKTERGIQRTVRVSIPKQASLLNHFKFQIWSQKSESKSGNLHSNADFKIQNFGTETTPEKQEQEEFVSSENMRRKSIAISKALENILPSRKPYENVLDDASKRFAADHCAPFVSDSLNDSIINIKGNEMGDDSMVLEYAKQLSNKKSTISADVLRKELKKMEMKSVYNFIQEKTDRAKNSPVEAFYLDDKDQKNSWTAEALGDKIHIVSPEEVSSEKQTPSENNAFDFSKKTFAISNTIQLESQSSDPNFYDPEKFDLDFLEQPQKVKDFSNPSGFANQKKPKTLVEEEFAYVFKPEKSSAKKQEELKDLSNASNQSIRRNTDGSGKKKIMIDPNIDSYLPSPKKKDESDQISSVKNILVSQPTTTQKKDPETLKSQKPHDLFYSQVVKLPSQGDIPLQRSGFYPELDDMSYPSRTASNIVGTNDTKTRNTRVVSAVFPNTLVQVHTETTPNLAKNLDRLSDILSHPAENAKITKYSFDHLDIAHSRMLPLIAKYHSIKNPEKWFSDVVYRVNKHSVSKKKFLIITPLAVIFINPASTLFSEELKRIIVLKNIERVITNPENNHIVISVKKDLSSKSGKNDHDEILESYKPDELLLFLKTQLRAAGLNTEVKKMRKFVAVNSAKEANIFDFSQMYRSKPHLQLLVGWATKSSKIGFVKSTSHNFFGSAQDVERVMILLEEGLLILSKTDFDLTDFFPLFKVKLQEPDKRTLFLEMGKGIRKQLIFPSELDKSQWKETIQMRITSLNLRSMEFTS